MSFLWTVPREEVGTGLSIIAGEEVGFDGIPFANLKGRNLLGNNARRGRRFGGRRFVGQQSGGGESWPIRRGRGGGRPWRNLLNSLDRLAGDFANACAGNTQIVQLAVRQAVQLRHGFAIEAPVAIVADQVHGLFDSSLVRSFLWYALQIRMVGTV